jgi:uncharacterized protein YggE
MLLAGTLVGLLTAQAVALPAPLVEVTIVASGRSETPAQVFRITVFWRDTAPGSAKAKRTEAQVKLRGASIPGLTISEGSKVGFVSEPSGGISFIGNEKFADEEPGEGQASPPMSETLTVEVADAAGADRAIALLRTTGPVGLSGPQPLLNDGTGALRAAKLNALANARTEADAYVKTLGMTRSTLIRITEQPRSETETMMRLMQQQWIGRAVSRTSVATEVTLSVTFDLTRDLSRQ